MYTRLSHAFIRISVSLILCATFNACTAPAPEPLPPPLVKAKKPHAKPLIVKPHYEMYDYIKELVMVQNTTDEKAFKARLAVIQDFADDKQDAIISQPVIIISYTIKKHQEPHTLVIPFKLQKDGADFMDLEPILSTLNGINYTMADIHPFVVVNAASPRNLQLPENAPNATRKILTQELKSLLVNTATFSDIDETNVQLQLLQYFISHHIRDAAYLCAENAKQSLAKAEQTMGDNSTTKSLSGRLDVLEVQLKKEMPFTLNSL